MTAPSPLLPRKLRRGDTVCVVAPALSRAIVAEHDHGALIAARFAALGLRVTFGDHVDERDDFGSSPVAARVADLHAAFADPDVAGILTVLGGFNSNQLLPHLDWDLIAANPKIFCGYSDITALQNAILARTGLITYSGPHWSTFGMRDHLEPTQAWFAEVLFGDGSSDLRPADAWTDDLWFIDQDDRTVHPGEGWWPLAPGQAAGRIVGGNLGTLSLLQGTGYLPSLLEQIIAGQDRLTGLPVLGNVDFGHTNPLATFPIGGRASLTVGATSSLRIADS
jgi:muramoyltetrapeptide carboxypeptidase LdcA involved in peptidoglycan recycling